MSRQPFEFKVWDIPNNMFLTEFQTDQGQWVWGRRKDLVGQSTFKWVLDHPDDFVVCMYVGVNETEGEKRKIFTGDILECWDHAADEGVGKRHQGVIEFVPSIFSLNCNGVYLPNWPNAENIEILGNIYENKDLLWNMTLKNSVK